MRVGIVGTGYVGLVTGAGLAEMGNQVVCVDLDEERIRQIKKGVIPFYEPGLPELVDTNLREGRLRLTTNLKAAVEESQVLFLAVGTPSGPDGNADLSAVHDVATSIGKYMTGPTLVATKSTVPVGTANVVKRLIEAETDHKVYVVANPEFLAQGSAVNDFLKPNRVIIGSDDDEGLALFKELYSPFLRTGNPIVTMDLASAEMTKYVSNAFLATKISFMNEMSRLCEKVGADVESVRVGIGSDPRIGKQFMFPGVGYGGSCLPKDNRALIHMGEQHGAELPLVQAALDNNALQRANFMAKLSGLFKDGLSGKKIAMWGLSFKPQTDDTREAPSLEIVEKLVAAGATVAGYDPQSINRPFEKHGAKFRRVDHSYDACEGADALAILTEWHEFRRPNFDRLLRLLKNPWIVDGRNLYNPRRMTDRGFLYLAMGRSNEAEFAEPKNVKKESQEV
jgi:UDPglucose 6-dehydrogenase